MYWLDESFCFWHKFTNTSSHPCFSFFARWLSRLNMAAVGYAERERMRQEQGQCSFHLSYCTRTSCVISPIDFNYLIILAILWLSVPRFFQNTFLVNFSPDQNYKNPMSRHVILCFYIFSSTSTYIHITQMLFFSSFVFLLCFFQFAATTMFLTVMHKKTNKASKWGCVQPWMTNHERARAWLGLWNQNQRESMSSNNLVCV